MLLPGLLCQLRVCFSEDAGTPSEDGVTKKETPETDSDLTQMLHGAGIFTYIYPINDPNVAKYSIHRAYGLRKLPEDALGRWFYLLDVATSGLRWAQSFSGMILENP